MWIVDSGLDTLQMKSLILIKSMLFWYSWVYFVCVLSWARYWWDAKFWLISQICYFQDRLVTFFVTHVCPIFALNYVSEDDYDCSSDNKYGNMFAVHTTCLLVITIYCIWKNIYSKLQKNWLKRAWKKNSIRLCSMS